jgi:16S rRNA (guanine1207-N2)-methyltransferase
MISELPPLPSEQLLIEHLPAELSSLPGDAAGKRRGLVISPGRAQLAGHLLERFEVAQVSAWYVDLFSAAMAGQVCPEQVAIICSADLPEEPIDIAVMPVLIKGEAEFTRDVMQQAHARLVEGGILVTAVNNPKDQWLHEQMQALFDKVSCQRVAEGCVYWGRKTGELKKFKDFNCQFAFKDDCDRLIQVVSRPSVFSHRRLDPGARQLMLAAEIGEADHVLDMGCGAGALALASAFKTTGTVTGVDSNARAVQCLQQGAELNGLSNVRAELNADGQLDLPQPVDVALANPPYFGDDHISQHFVDTCVQALRPGGALLVVTKQPNWYEAYFEQLLEDIVIFESAKYFVACGRRPL